MKFAVLLFLVGVIVAVSADCDYKGKTYKVGESWQPEGKCELTKCTGVNELIGETCALETADESKYTYVPQDNTKKYPDCCPHYVPK